MFLLLLSKIYRTRAYRNFELRDRAVDVYRLPPEFLQIGSLSCEGAVFSVLASCNEKEQGSEKLLARWGRSLSRYSKCCSGMRCLACRRDPKGLLWTRNQKRMMEPKAKLPDVLVEHNSVMRGAIPCLPVPLAWFCLMWNVLLPGTGTVWSGLFNLCTGQPRFSPVAGLKSRLGALIVNLVVGVGQLFTVLFCLVGWGWSIWWGVNMVRLASKRLLITYRRKYKRFKASEAASNDLEARGGEPGPLPPGVPSQALREMERAR
ncbi:protein spec3 [Lasius niger]|uniref:Protein spec3 n=1 Tax=Lasius niger TaxID=67767 RepID=A0A0J7P0U7_LASNI|nr:protein spec3 [Lasius niger]